MALPRRGVSPQLLGALIAALGLGGIFLALGLRSPHHLPNFNFYLFSLIGLGSALRVISHPRPVYAALYFILTILASSGLYVLMSAEFMAFALIIVYAGAILITYLFVLMLATEGPTADQIESLNEYDRYSREPVMATITGFILLAGLTAMLGIGASKLTPATEYAAGGRLAQLPFRVEKALIATGAMARATEPIARDAKTGAFQIETAHGQVVGVTVAYGTGATRTVTSTDAKWPKDLKLTNVEGVGFTLLADHPGGIEVAGVVLLMAMLGAVVLARKKVELDDQAKFAAQSHALVDDFSARGMHEATRMAHIAAPTTPIVHTGVNTPALSGGHGGNGKGHAHGSSPHSLTGGGR
jgi:NADH-quinone oxidoreductase subunit J